MTKPIRWGVLATGNIANTFTRAVKFTGNSIAHAVASRSQQSADEFGNRHEINRCYGSYQQLLDDPEIHAIYVSTPHPMHHEWVIKAARAKKHILCEKPIAMNARETEEMIAAARESDVALMEAFMYRVHPQTLKVMELIRSGAIGEVKVIHGIYGFTAPYHADGRLWNKALGGGAILDVGCYPASSSRLYAGVALGRDFADPIDIQATGHIGETGVDEWTGAVVRFPGDIVAQWSTGLRLNYENQVRIHGTGGWIHLSQPHHPCYWGGESRILIRRLGFTPVQEITIRADKPLFTYAIEAFAQAILEGKRELTGPGMSWADSIGNMKATDLWRERIGLSYDADRR